jgi:hypothetical protein
MPTPLFATAEVQRIRLADHLDAINDRYGEYVIYPAAMMGLEHEYHQAGIIKRVPFHATRDTPSKVYSRRPRSKPVTSLLRLCARSL